jgi:hypothetical protein
MAKGGRPQQVFMHQRPVSPLRSIPAEAASVARPAFRLISIAECGFGWFASSASEFNAISSDLAQPNMMLSWDRAHDDRWTI